MVITACEVLFVMILASVVMTQVIVPLWQEEPLFPACRRSPPPPQVAPPPLESELWIDKAGTIRTQKPGERADD